VAHLAAGAGRFRTVRAMVPFASLHHHRHGLTVLEVVGVLLLTMLIATAGMAYLIAVQDDAHDQAALLRMSAVQSAMAGWAGEQPGFTLPATVEGREVAGVTLVTGPAAGPSQVSAHVVADRKFVLTTRSEAGGCVALAQDLDGSWGVAAVAEGTPCDAAVAAPAFSDIQAGPRSLSVEIGN